MNPKQQRFVQEYLKDSNATQAAIRAGYSEKTAGSQGHDLLKKPEIAAAVQVANERAGEQAGMTKEQVLLELATLARSAEKDTDRIAALVAIGKHFKLFTDKIQHEVGKSYADLVLESMKTPSGKDEDNG